MHNDLERIASALERIASAVEDSIKLAEEGNRAMAETVKTTRHAADLMEANMLRRSIPG